MSPHIGDADVTSSMDTVGRHDDGHVRVFRHICQRTNLHATGAGIRYSKCKTPSAEKFYEIFFAILHDVAWSRLVPQKVMDSHG